jgi:hypothetical protein
VLVLSGSVMPNIIASVFPTWSQWIRGAVP